VQDSVYDTFVEKFAAAVANLKIGAGWETDVTQGPLINAAALSRVQGLLADLKGEGAAIVCGGQPHSRGGLFFEPTIVRDVKNDSALAQSELFGPIAPVIRFKTEAEAIQLANDTEFGLASYFYSQNINRIFRVSEALEYGMVGVNEGIISTEVAPFGGVKSSGLGREGSKYGIDEYLEIKYVCIGGVN
jgi:succinate-semialdehyde dehydrogenase/glutarate-semialdehyde dehydrogenase